MIRKIVILVLILAAAGGAAFYFFPDAFHLSGGKGKKGKSLSGKSADPLPDIVQTAVVKKRSLVHNVDLAGDVTPVQQVDVKAEISYKIKKIMVAVGQQVKKGDILVELDDGDIKTNLSVADRDVDSANFALVKAKRDFDRNQQLFSQKLVSQQAFDDARTDLDTAQNAYDKAQNSRQQINDQLFKTKIPAPMDGIILSIPVVEGQVVIGAASVNSGTLLMTIADMSQMVINAQVNQVDIAYIHSGLPARFTVESIKDVSMEGSVNIISPVATVVNNLKGFSVQILIKNPNPNLRPGMTADVVVPVEAANDVPTIPLTAVFTDEDGNSVVYLPPAAEGELPAKRAVTLGIVNYDFAQILSGLKEGETVLLSKPKAVKGG